MAFSSYPQGTIGASVVGEVVEFDLAAYAADAFRIAPLDATALITVTSSGTILRSLNNAPATQIGTWIKGGGAPENGGDYDIQAETTGGNGLDIGVADTWQALSASRSYGCIATGNFDFDNFTGIFRIRPSGGGGDLDTATCAISATTEL